jgi:hypothetical protein
MNPAQREQPILFVKWYHLDSIDTAIAHVHRTLTLADAPRRTRVHIRPHFPEIGEESDRLVIILQMVIQQVDVSSLTRKILERRHEATPKYPAQYHNELERISSELDEIATLSWELITWRLNIVGALRPSPRTFSLFWRHGLWTDSFEVFDGWKQVPSGVITLEMAPSVELEIPDATLRDLSQRFLQIHHAPLAHSLMREAERLLPNEVRSAVVVAVAAIETAVKQFIAELAPDTTWLLDEISSPPVVKLLAHLVPETSKRRRQLQRPPKKLMTIVESMVRLRNEIVHGHRTNVARRDIEKLFPQIRDILFMLDYARGETWALSHVSSDTRAN